ncbi:hypothetical protein [Nonomuraea dietziae]|uniref:hypothetical protein n=1 Tax=Nonomuraea dietziae TaxID=65515 RepID=UPI0033FD0510
MAAPDIPADAADAARAWLEQVANNLAYGDLPSGLAPAQVCDAFIILDPPPDEDAAVLAGPQRVRRLVFEAILYDGRTVTVVREATDEQIVHAITVPADATPAEIHRLGMLHHLAALGEALCPVCAGDFVQAVGDSKGTPGSGQPWLYCAECPCCPQPWRIAVKDL